MKKLIFVAASVVLLIVGIGAGAVLSTDKRVAHYGPNFVCLLNAEAQLSVSARIYSAWFRVFLM